MRFRRADGRPSAAFFGATGWLFADLLLALTILFLVANTFVQIPPPPPVCGLPPATPIPGCITPTPTATPTPTPTPVPPPLNLQPIIVSVTVNHQLLLSGDTGELNRLRTYMETYPGLPGRSAGLVLDFAGAPQDSDNNTALAVAQAFDRQVLEYLGCQSPSIIFPCVAPNSSKEGQLYLDYHNLGKSLDSLEVHVYLFQGGA